MDDSARQAEVKILLDRLSALIPSEGGWVKFERDQGDPHGGPVIGDRTGYQRLGFELLRNGFAEPEPGTRHLPVELGDLLDDSPIQLSRFELGEKREEQATSASSSGNTLALIGCALLALTAMYVFVVGFQHLF